MHKDMARPSGGTEWHRETLDRGGVGIRVTDGAVRGQVVMVGGARGTRVVGDRRGVIVNIHGIGGQQIPWGEHRLRGSRRVVKTIRPCAGVRKGAGAHQVWRGRRVGKTIWPVGIGRGDGDGHSGLGKGRRVSGKHGQEMWGGGVELVALDVAVDEGPLRVPGRTR